MQRFACKFCIALRGLKGVDVPGLPVSFEEIAEHIEDTHGYPVGRKGEDPVDTYRRFSAKHGFPRTAAEILGNELAARLVELSGPVVSVTLVKEELLAGLDGASAPN